MRILRYLAVATLLAAVACTQTPQPAGTTEAALPDGSGWRLPSGKPPTKAEFTALAATCQAEGGAYDSCLTDLGLKKTP